MVLKVTESAWNCCLAVFQLPLGFQVPFVFVAAAFNSTKNPSLTRYCENTYIGSFKNKTNILCESQRTGNELRTLTPKLWIASKATFNGFAKQNLVWTSNLLAAAADGLQIVYPSLSPPWVMFSVRKKPFISIHLTLFSYARSMPLRV